MNLMHDGGPAFPQPPVSGVFVSTGMSMRDYLAALAMHALLNREKHMDYLAHTAYAWADAMLAERVK